MLTGSRIFIGTGRKQEINAVVNSRHGHLHRAECQSSKWVAQQGIREDGDCVGHRLNLGVHVRTRRRHDLKNEKKVNIVNWAPQVNETSLTSSGVFVITGKVSSTLSSVLQAS